MSETKTKTFVDRTGWPAGPWDDEPDRVEWMDEATGLTCLALRRSRFGHWCGYVAVPPDHPLHGRDCEVADAVVDVHGGFTHADACMDDGRPKHEQVCHVPAPGEPDDVWWFGFDFAHCDDLSPGLTRHYGPIGGEVYRTLDYVRGECVSVARQLYVGTA